MRTIEIDLTEEDLDNVLSRVVHHNEKVEWVFPTNDGEVICIRFIPYTDEEENEK